MGLPAETARAVDRLNAALDTLEAKPGHDLAGMLAAATDVEREARALPDAATEMRARLVRGDALDRLGDLPAGARLILEVNRWATSHRHRALQSRSHLLLSAIFHNLGDPAGSLDHAVRGIELLDDGAPPKLRAQYLTTLADALGWVGSFDDARERYREAERILVAADDPYRQINVLNNLAYTEYEAGEPERAWETVQRMLAVAAANGLSLDASLRDTTARAQIGVGRYAEAEETLRPCVDDAEAGDDPYQQVDTLAENLLTLAEAQRLQGHTERAQASLDRCRLLCDDRELADVRVRIAAEQAELHAAAGDFRQAYLAHKAFHTGHEALRSVEREAQARNRQAVFETTEARAQAQRFREQALRDPLTRLYNRRFVDEKLTLLLADAARTGTPVTAALLDLDYFKRINDEFSHDIGDRVLVVVAGLLGEAVDDGHDHHAGDESFAARLGGEEFLLVLVGLRPADAVERLEKLRLAVAGYPWAAITADLPVTISVGVTTARPESTQSSLLARADHCLYTAKRDGRNQVHVDRRR